MKGAANIRIGAAIVAISVNRPESIGKQPGEQEIVERLARLRHESGKDEPLEPKLRGHAAHGLHHCDRSVKPIHALDEIEGLPPEGLGLGCHQSPDTLISSLANYAFRRNVSDPLWASVRNNDGENLVWSRP